MCTMIFEVFSQKSVSCISFERDSDRTIDHLFFPYCVVQNLSQIHHWSLDTSYSETVSLFNVFIDDQHYK